MVTMARIVTTPVTSAARSSKAALVHVTATKPGERARASLDDGGAMSDSVKEFFTDVTA